MDTRLQIMNRRALTEAGPSTSFHPRNRNDQYLQRYFNRDVSVGNQSKWNNQPTRLYPKDDKDGQHPKRNNHQYTRSNSGSSENSSHRLESAKSKLYICPNCKHPYYYFISNNAIAGKVPRILPCRHTICEECIKKCIKITNHIQCNTCLKSEFHKKQIGEYNHYILGQLTSSRFNKSIMEPPNIALVSAESKHPSSSKMNKLASTDLLDKCGFKDCINSGTVSCVDCSGIYCKKCDNDLHKSGKQLMSHKRVPISIASFELSKCSEHSMYEEIYCNECKETLCCYCILDKHEGHSRAYLDRLSNGEEKELMDAYDKAKLKRNQLLISQKKIVKIEATEVESDLAVEIAQKFADIHAHLYFIEKTFHEEANRLKNENSNMEELSGSIGSDIERLNYLINCVDGRKTTKFNLRMLLDKLKEIENLPTVLASNDNSGKPKLIVDERINDIEQYFKLDIPGKVAFSLVQVEKVPQEYQEELELPKAKISADSDYCRSVRYKYDLETKEFNKFKQQAVFVTHINSLDSFYVQFKDEGHKFQQLEQEIKNHISRMNIGVDTVQLKELYMARSVCDKKTWCRVRVMEEKEGGRYKVKFIDFGNSTEVGKHELVYVSSSLAKKKPFAFECRMHNPTAIEWPKRTHLELAKLLDVNKELVIYIKDSSNDIYTVELFINTSIGGLCSVTDLLIFGCEALKKKPLTETSQNRIFENSDVFVVGHSYEVFIRHISDPWHIYVQKTSYESTFNDLMKHMEQFYKNSGCDIHLPIKNSYVVIYYQSNDYGNWHRSKILDVLENKKTVNVYLIDLGRSLNVSWKDLRKLSLPFKKSESLVVCAKLGDVAPLNTDSWQPTDGPDAINYLETFMKRTVHLKMLVSNNDPLEIVLFEPFETYDININAVLVEKKFASSTGRLTSTNTWIHKDTVDTKGESNILFFKDVSDEEEIENDIPGIKLEVEIVQFENPSSFYVSFVSKKKMAEKLHEELQIHFKSQTNYRTDYEWKENEKIVAYDSSDKMYYRGVIQAVESNKYCIRLLDRPDYLWVESEKLRNIPTYFESNFPNIVFKCHLANIKPAGDSNKWSKLSLEWFEMLFKKHDNICIKKIGDDASRLSMPVTMLYAKVIQGSALEPSYRKYVSIDKKVVKAGLAFWVNNQLSSVTDEPSVKQQVMPEVHDDRLPDKTIETTESSQTEEVEPSREIMAVGINQWPAAPKLTSAVFKAYITCAEHEGYLYIRDEKMQEVYEEMEKNMKKQFDTIPKAKNFTLRANQLVMVKSEGFWYRAIITSVLDANTARIIMVDFGSDHVVKRADLHNKIMYPEMPIMVSKIQLFNVESINKNWTDMEVNALVDAAPEYAKIVLQSPMHDSIPLADVYDMDDVCLNDKVVELCPNLFRSKSNLNIISSININESLPTNRRENNAREVITQDSKEKGGDRAGIKEKTINPTIETKLNWADEVQDEIMGDAEQKYEDIEEPGFEDLSEPTSEDEVEQTNENANEVIEKTNGNGEEDSSAGGDGSAAVCDTKDFVKRYIYPPFEDKTVEMEIIDIYDYKTISLYNPDAETTEADFEALTDSIKDNVATLDTLQDIEVGMPCLSLFEDRWYRAKIIKADAQLCGYVKVIYVDYGNFEVVKASDLRNILPEWLRFPARFIEVSIAYSLLQKDKEDVLLKHIQFLSGETKYIKVVENSPLLVHVYNKVNDNFELYYDAFVKNDIVKI